MDDQYHFPRLSFPSRFSCGEQQLGNMSENKRKSFTLFSKSAVLSIPRQHEKEEKEICSFSHSLAHGPRWHGHHCCFKESIINMSNGSKHYVFTQDCPILLGERLKHIEHIQIIFNQFFRLSYGWYSQVTASEKTLQPDTVPMK